VGVLAKEEHTMTITLEDFDGDLAVLNSWVAQDFPGPQDARAIVYARANALARLAVTA
jgi:hypothetical protein